MLVTAHDCETAGLFYSQNNTIVWLLNMADILKNARGVQRFVGFFSFRDCTFRMLIGCAGKLRSRGCIDK